MSGTPSRADDPGSAITLESGPWTATLDARGQITIRGAGKAPAPGTPLAVGTRVALTSVREDGTTVTRHHEDGAPVTSARRRTAHGDVDIVHGLLSGPGWGMLIITAECVRGRALVELLAGEPVHAYSWEASHLQQPALSLTSTTMSSVPGAPAVTLTTRGLGPLSSTGSAASSKQLLETRGRAYVVLWWGVGVPTVPATWREARALLAQARREWQLGGGAGRGRQLLSGLTSLVETAWWLMAPWWERSLGSPHRIARAQLGSSIAALILAAPVAEVLAVLLLHGPSSVRVVACGLAVGLVLVAWSAVRVTVAQMRMLTRND